MAKGTLGDALSILLKYQRNDYANDVDNQPTIHDAAKRGDVELVLKFCENNADIDQENEWGDTPLIIATAKNHESVVGTLLEHGASQRPSETTGNTPLHFVKDARIAYLLIEHGGEVNKRNSFNATPLHKAMYQSNFGLVNILLENNADINARTDEGLLPLHCIFDTDEPSLNIVSRLIDAGSNVNAVDYTDRTPLHHYCNGYIFSVNMLQLLLSKGCKLDMKDYKGNCPIHSYLTTNTSPDINFLTSLCPDRKATNLTDYRGRSPLFLSVLNMDISSIKALISLGADVNLKDNLGKTALHYVTDNNTTEYVISYLILSGTDIHSQDKWGRTAIFDYVDSKNRESCKILLKQGSNVNHQDICGLSPLHIACLRGLDKAVEEMLNNGAKINIVDSSGGTPLHSLATTEHVNIVTYLVGEGADKSIKDKNGLTPFELANLYGNNDIASLLEGSSSRVKDNELSSICKEYMSLKDAEFVIENKKCKRSHETLESYYSAILNTPVVGMGIVDGEAKEIQIVIENQIQFLSTQIGKLDERFQNVVLHAGSSSEGTKTNLPDEFDYMFSLENFNLHCEFKSVKDDEIKHPRVTLDNLMKFEVDFEADESNFDLSDEDSDSVNQSLNPDILEVPVSDYVRVSLKDGAKSEKIRQIMSSASMRCGIMNLIFSQLIERVIFSQTFPRDPRLIPKEVTLHPSLKYVWNGRRYKGMVVDVDLVPALRLPSWPPKVNKESSLFDDELSSIVCMVVPKTTASSHSELWRCSLALVETAIFRKLKYEVRNAYILCKSMKSAHFLPSIDFEDKFSEESKVICRQLHPELEGEELHEYTEVGQVLPSYILKMAFLGLIEEKINQYGATCIYKADNTGDEVTIYKRDRVNYGPAIHMNTAESNSGVRTELVKEVFQKSLEYMSQRYVPSVFNKRHNILGEELLFGGGIEKATVFLKLILELLRE